VRPCGSHSSVLKESCCFARSNISFFKHNVVFVELSRDGETIVVSQEVPAARAQCAAVDGSRQATDRQKVGAALLRSPAATPR